MKLLEDNERENLMTSGVALPFRYTTKGTTLEKMIDKLDLIKIRNFCSMKDNVKRIRRQATDWAKILAKDI